MEPTDFQVGDFVVPIGGPHKGRLGVVDAIDVNFVYVSIQSATATVIRYFPLDLEIV